MLLVKKACGIRKVVSSRGQHQGMKTGELQNGRIVALVRGIDLIGQKVGNKQEKGKC